MSQSKQSRVRRAEAVRRTTAREFGWIAGFCLAAAGGLNVLMGIAAGRQMGSQGVAKFSIQVVVFDLTLNVAAIIAGMLWFRVRGR